jgi:hypothetical protein
MATLPGKFSSARNRMVKPEGDKLFLHAVRRWHRQDKPGYPPP